MTYSAFYRRTNHSTSPLFFTNPDTGNVWKDLTIKDTQNPDVHLVEFPVNPLTLDPAPGWELDMLATQNLVRHQLTAMERYMGKLIAEGMANQRMDGLLGV